MGLNITGLPDLQQDFNTMSDNFSTASFDSLKVIISFFEGDDFSFLKVMGLKIFGSPWQPDFSQSAFCLQRGEKLRDK